MILLLTTAPVGASLAQALLAATKQKVEIALDYAQAQEFLREHDVAALIFDTSSLSSDCAAAMDVVKHAANATIVEVNFAIHSEARVIRDVQQALRRYHHQLQVAQNVAQAELSSQITGDVTGILVASQMALHEPALPSKAQDKVREVYEIALRLRERFKPHD